METWSYLSKETVSQGDLIWEMVRHGLPTVREKRLPQWSQTHKGERSEVVPECTVDEAD
jgi:hypothetical protein